jgi:hypothetical protein
MPKALTIVFTPNGGDAVTLLDAEAKHTGRIQSWSGAALEDVETMFEQMSPLRLMLGNVAGDFVMVSELEQESHGAMLAYFMEQRGLINQVGVLTVTVQDVVATMQNAACKSVEPVSLETAVRWPLKYVFGISLIDPPETDPAN